VADVPDVAVTVINVGYGDAILVQLGGQSFLIDTGEKQAGLAVLRALAMRGVKSLDGVFLTHMHNDHIGGLETAAQRYEIGTLYAAGISQSREKADKLAAKRGLKLTRLFAGDTVETESGAVFEVLGPIEFNSNSDNDNSLILRLEAGGFVWLFTGDMQFDEEISLMNAGADLKADVLKVGNHGNPDATSNAFGKAVSPTTAVISTSTKKDDDSANPRVFAALDGADVYVTQDFVLGVLLTAKGGVLTVEDPKPQEADVTISLAIDTDAQTVTLTGDRDTDLSGWLIWSEKGGELFVFPQGAALKAGQPLTVACRGGGTGDFLWNEKKVWSDKKGEAAVLVSGSGALAARQPV
jgi:competence protein ComEC